MKPQTKDEYTKFTNALRKVLKVSHSDMQSRIENEKRARKQRKTRTSAHASGVRG
jgi:hypothetical protein